MSRIKDIYMAELERHIAELEEQGMSPDKAYDLASNSAFHALGDRMADMADAARDRQKDK